VCRSFRADRRCRVLPRSKVTRETPAVIPI